MEPVLETFNEKHPDVTILKVNVDEHRGLMISHKVSSIPTYVYYLDDDEVDRTSGAQPITQLEELVGIH